jgi:hypothetical protein
MQMSRRPARLFIRLGCVGKNLAFSAPLEAADKRIQAYCKLPLILSTFGKRDSETGRCCHKMHLENLPATGHGKYSEGLIDGG